MELAKRLRSDPPSPTPFAGMVKVKPKVLTLQEANKKMLRDEGSASACKRLLLKNPR